jgi:hypothetical protein
MGIIRNIQNNIVVIYEIKSFYVTLAAGIFFSNNIHRANYHFTHCKKLKKSIISPYYRWVVLCTVKDLYLSMLGIPNPHCCSLSHSHYPRCSSATFRWLVLHNEWFSLSLPPPLPVSPISPRSTGAVACIRCASLFFQHLSYSIHRSLNCVCWLMIQIHCKKAG